MKNTYSMIPFIQYSGIGKLTCVCMLSRFSHVQLLVTPCTVARQAPLSMGVTRQEHWSGLPCPPPEDLPDPGIEPTCLASPALAGRFFTTAATWEAPELGFFALTLHALYTLSLVLGFGICVCVFLNHSE